MNYLCNVFISFFFKSFDKDKEMILYLPLRGEISYILFWKNARHMGYKGAKWFNYYAVFGQFYYLLSVILKTFAVRCYCLIPC